MQITLSEYQKRRATVLSKMPPNSLALLVGAKSQYRNRDTEYPFRQNSDFYYLTGFSEPNAVLVLLKKAENETHFILFCEKKDPAFEVWNGERLGLEGALQSLKADQAYPIETIHDQLPILLADIKTIFYTFNVSVAWDQRLVSTVQEGCTWVDLLSIIHEARLIKSEAEVMIMRKAAEISADAHIALMKICGPEMIEYELEARFVYECLKNGCRSMAYSTIVGGGNRACTLHYVQNNQPLKSGELVLVDAGAEYQNYAADITRTFPVNGKFTSDQTLIYALVLKAQLAAIELIKPGVLFDVLQNTMVRILVSGLVDLGILKGDIDTLISEKAYKPFYMHGGGHWLGLDVHDVGTYQIEANGPYRTLEAGMVLTVEPGLYIANDKVEVDARFRGIGIRIEDDVLVTKNGHEVLSHGVPKTIEAIEAYCQENQHERR